jgi:UDPglucose 6-dehydrogenase
MTSTTGTTISVIGCGYLGAVHACAMAELGHDVIGFDVDADRVAALTAGSAPFYEPGLDELLGRGLESGRLRFSTDPADLEDASIHFLCVGTPQAPGEDHADLSYLEMALESLLPALAAGDIVVGKSTVPVGTAAGIAERVRATEPGASLVWNPEFLREGFAIEDTLRPDRIVIGVGDDEPARAAGRTLESAYAGILELGTPLVRTDFQTAELAKTACNAFLATKISFINAMADLCDAAGGDVTALADIMGHDERIGRRFLNAGVGFGGGCLPKDIRAFAHRAGALGAGRVLSFLQEVDQINRGRRDRVVSMVQAWFAGDIVGRRIAVLGAAFKPDTDDIRDSPALATAQALHLTGAHVVVTDPRSVDKARAAHPQLSYADTVEEAVAGADLVVLLTEWREYLSLDPALLAKDTGSPRILDGRNALDVEQWTSAGWEYRCLGRPRATG